MKSRSIKEKIDRANENENLCIVKVTIFKKFK